MSNGRLISRLRSIDWDFAGSFSESLFSSIHWHPGRFASQLPAALIGLLSQPGDLILDPFAGSGTTLVEAQRLGRRSIGIDLNPISCLTTRAKTLLARAKWIGNAIREIKEATISHLDNHLTAVTISRVPPLIPATVQAEKWYTKKVLQDLGRLWFLINTYKGAKRTLAQAAFSAVLLSVCRETRHWGYVCDNSSPKTDHEGNVSQTFCRILDRLDLAYQERDAEILARDGKVGDIADAAVICADAQEALKRIRHGSVGLVVTSPPYFGVSDYIKAQRLSMEWFGYDIESLRLGEIGARSKRHRKSAYTEYQEELERVFRQLRASLRPGAFCAVFMGESSTRSSVLPGVRDALQSCGLSLKLDLNRRVSSQRRQAPSIKAEHLFLLAK